MADRRERVTKASRNRDPPPAPPPKYEPPNWAGKPPPGMHLDVTKADKLVEKLIIDGKHYFLFGRLRDHVDFPLDHASCSRVHAALIFHRHLQRMFIIDLGSTHGTFVGSVRVDPDKPVQVLADSTLHFGASTRCFTLREKPSIPSAMSKGPSKTNGENEIGIHGLLGLPEGDTELDDLTEYNTAHNRRLGNNFEEASTTTSSKKRKRSSACHVSFRDGEEIINPEDIDPTVGRFRNLVQTEVIIPSKKKRVEPQQSMTESITQRMQTISYAADLYADIPSASGENHSTGAMTGKIMITSAPEVESPFQHKETEIEDKTLSIQPVSENLAREVPTEPRKKKYAKEAWPGKKPGPNLFSV
eukprot:gene4971-5619_t